MIEVTFQTQCGIYWSICESLYYDRANKQYQLNSVLENSRGTGPAAQAAAPGSWQIIRVKEV